MNLLLIPYMAAMARASGGGLFAVWLRDKLGSFGGRVPEILFAAPFGMAAWQASGSVWCGLASWVWSYLAMETGHGNAYHMGFTEKNFPDRWQTLDYIVRPITSRLGFAPRSAGYCWVFMGLKGLFIGLPAGLPGLALAVLWPASYYASFRFTRSSELAEWLSGGSAGLLIACAVA